MRARGAAVTALLAAVAVGLAATVPGERRTFAHTTGVLHPYVHLGIFGAIAWFCTWSARSANVRALLCAGVVALGCVTELTEWYLYRGPLEVIDMLLDAIGAVTGTGLAALTADFLARRQE